MVPSPKISINPPRNHEKLHDAEEDHIGYAVYRDPSVQDRHTTIWLLLYKDFYLLLIEIICIILGLGVLAGLKANHYPNVF